MSPTKLVYTTLTTDAALAALVDGRIYPLRIPQNEALPAITYQQASRPNGGLRGCGQPDRGLVQVSIFAKSYEQVEAISTAVRRALDGYEVGQFSIEYENGRDLHDDTSETYFRADDYRVEVPAPA